jgi:hypothetical protein
MVPLDRDHDGRVSEAEYTAVARHAPPFFAVDTDKDGAVSVAEVEALLDETDPSQFDPGVRPRPITPHQSDSRPLPPPARALRDALRFEVEELHARAPTAALPTEADIAVVAEEGLTGEAGRRLVAQLRAAATAAGLDLPAELGGGG